MAYYAFVYPISFVPSSFSLAFPPLLSFVTPSLCRTTSYTADESAAFANETITNDNAVRQHQWDKISEKKRG